MDWKRMRRRGARTFVEPLGLVVDFGWWGLILVPIGLVLLIVAMWLVGVMSDGILGAWGGLVDYGERADLSENSRYLAWGAGISLAGWMLTAFGSAFYEEWSSWRSDVRMLRDKRRREREEEHSR